MSHSKRNTSLAFFTSYERSLLRNTWGSQATRLTRDSFLPFGSCLLCLLPSQDPVACCGGPVPTELTDDASASRKRKRGKEQTHIFCRECLMSNLLAQRKELKRLEKETTAFKTEAEEAESLEEAEAQRRAVEEFERTQAGLDSHHHSRSTGRKSIANDAPEDTRKRKRGFEFDAAECIEADRVKARKAFTEEKAAAEKNNSIQSFWIPSQTPSASKVPPTRNPTGGTDNGNGSQANDGREVKDKKSETLCPGSTPTTAHTVSLKTLISVSFTEEDDSKKTNSNGTSGKDTVARTHDGKIRICPACNKPLTNASKAVLARPCGHVLCGSCVDKFVMPSNTSAIDWTGESTASSKGAEIQCFVCSVDITEREGKKRSKKDKIRPGLVEICTEGTGFAGSGKNVVKREGVAFQC